MENKLLISVSSSEYFFFIKLAAGKIKTSTGLISDPNLTKKLLMRRLIKFLVVALAKTFLGTIKPKRGLFWFACLITRILIKEV